MFWIALSIYLFSLIAVTAYVRARHGVQSEGQTFYVANRSLSALVVAASLAATSVGGSSTVLTIILVNKHGLAGAWLDLWGVVGFLVLGFFLASRVRRSKALSIAELTGQYYGETVRKVAAVILVLAAMGWLALLTMASTAILAPTFPSIPAWHLNLMFVLVVMTYALIGGQFAVAFSDLAQLGFMFVGLCVVFPLAVYGQLPENSAFNFSFPTSPHFGIGQIVTFFCLTGLSHMVGPDIYAKVLAAKDERAAKQGALGAAGLKLIFALAMVFVGLCSSHILPATTVAENSAGQLIQNLHAGWVGAFIVVALLSTLMSSADQVLLSAITMVDHDLYKTPHQRMGQSPARRTRHLHLSKRLPCLAAQDGRNRCFVRIAAP